MVLPHIRDVAVNGRSRCMYDSLRNDLNCSHLGLFIISEKVLAGVGKAVSEISPAEDT